MRVDAQLLDVVELLRQAGEVADAVAVGVVERLDVHLVDDGVLVPERVVAHGCRLAVPLTWLVTPAQGTRFRKARPRLKKSARRPMTLARTCARARTRNRHSNPCSRPGCASCRWSACQSSSRSSRQHCWCRCASRSTASSVTREQHRVRTQERLGLAYVAPLNELCRRMSREAPSSQRAPACTSMALERSQGKRRAMRCNRQQSIARVARQRPRGVTQALALLR